MAHKSIKDKYINKVKTGLYNLPSAKDFIDMLTSDVLDYIDNTPGCTYEDIVNQFGRPEDVAQDYLAESDSTQPKKLIKSNKKKIIIICILIAGLLAGGLYLFDMHMNNQAKASDVVTVHDN